MLGCAGALGDLPDQNRHAGGKGLLISAGMPRKICNGVSCPPTGVPTGAHSSFVPNAFTAQAGAGFVFGLTDSNRLLMTDLMLHDPLSVHRSRILFPFGFACVCWGGGQGQPPMTLTSFDIHMFEGTLGALWVSLLCWAS